MKSCPKCKAHLLDDAEVCSCGNWLRQAATTTPAGQPAPPTGANFRKAKIPFALSFYPLLLLYLLFALPLIGNFAFPYVAHEYLNCRAGIGSGVAHCYRNGVNVSELSYNYGMTILAMGLFNPVYALSAVKAIIPKYILLLWLLLIGYSFHLKRKYRE